MTDVVAATPRRRATSALLSTLLVGAGLVGVVATTAEPAAAVPSGFQDQLLWSGFTAPMAIAFAPDGKVFVAEKSGAIYRYDSVTDTSRDLVVDMRDNVNTVVDRGLLGLAVDPNFSAARPFIYVQYTYDHVLGSSAAPPRWGPAGSEFDACPNPPGDTDDGCVVSGRVSKLVLSSPSGGVASEQVLVEDWCQQYPSHSIGTIVFGDDGMLYAGGGDGASYNFADYGQGGGPSGSITPYNPCGDPPTAIGVQPTPATAQGGSLRSQAARLTARESTTGKVTLSGSVIRIHPDTGAGVPGNPWFTKPGADDNEKRIIAYGLRNPFRFSTRGGSNELWLGDVGWTDWEEINVIPDPTTMSAPINYGWPCYEGNARQGGYDAANLNACENLYAQGASAVRAPHYAYNHNAHPVPNDGCGTGASAIAGTAYYNRPTTPGLTPYPARYDGALFFTDYNRRCIWVMLNGANGRPDPTQLEMFHKPVGGIVDLVVGPGGDIFYPDADNGTVRVIRYFPDNQPPLASFTATPSFGQAPLDVAFNASGSSDPENGPLAYAWDLDGDGQYDDATGVTATRTYAAGNHTVGFRVTDAQGAFQVASKVITSGNSPPTATITTPSAGLTWKVGDQIPFSGSATDPENGTLAPARLRWDVSLLTCDATGNNCVTRRSTVYDGIASGTATAPDWSGEGNNVLEFKLTATDQGGLTDVKTVRLNPQNVTLTFQSSPPGASIAVDSQVRTAPFSRTVIVGSQNSLSAPTPQAFGNTSYEFVSWSDGGPASHVVDAPSSATTYTATFGAVAQGLVAAYGFDEGSGASSSDASGNGNGGALSDTAWDTVGRFGKSLSFNGTSSWVTVPDSSSLDLTNGMTLEAWLRPTVVSSWQSAIMKQNSATTDFVYAIMSNTPGGGPGGWVNIGGEKAAETATRLTPNTWVHIATTYDGANLRLYINGTLTATRPTSGAMNPSTGVLRIGGNSIWGEYFNGSIDEVRIYNRALTNAEISTDMNTPVNAGPPDTQAPSAPGTLTATDGVGSVSLSWGPATDNVGVDHYNVHRSTTAGFTPSAGNRIAQPTGTSYTDTTTAGTYYYRVVAEDAAALVGPASNQASATVTGDVTPPSAPGTLTATGAVGQATLDWGPATDNVGVVRYNVHRSTTAGFTPAAGNRIAQPTGTSHTDTTTPGTYYYRVIAEDAAGNLGPASNQASATVTAPASALVAAYGFNEGAGTTATDASGRGNTGTAANTAWDTVGRFGKSLSFNGTSSWVTVPDSSSLDLTNGMTLEAWLRPTVVSSWQSAIMKQNSATTDFVYAIMSNTPGGGPGGWVNIGGEKAAETATRLTPNTWVHIATTYDGANLRLYINGTLTATRPTSGAMNPSTGVLRIGGNSIWGEYFNGSIDEVRIYNRALTNAEISTDMNTPVNAGPPDTQAPSAPGTLTATDGVGSVSLSWGPATDNVGVDHYNVHRSTTAGFTPSAGNRIAQPTGTSYTDTTTAGTYYYRVVAEDAAALVGPASNQASATVTGDVTPPSAPGTLTATGAVGQATLDWGPATDNVGVVRYNVHRSTTAGFTPAAGNRIAQPTGTSHTDTTTPGTYYYRVIAEDAAGNLGPASNQASATVTAPASALVAAYGFNEGAGTTATDASGRGNTGTAANTAWDTVGRFGKSLSFNGTSSWVTVPDSSSLDLTNGMTLEAWLRPTVVSSWQSAIMKQNSATTDFVYAIMSNTPGGGPGGWVNIGGEKAAETATRLTPNTWVHIATTYDGANLRLYINGTLTATRPTSGAMNPSTGVLRIGGNSIWGEYFNGSIDEVRIYNRALTNAEISTDMNTAI